MDLRRDAAPTGYGRRWSNGATRPTDAGLMDGRAQLPLLLDDDNLPVSLVSIREMNRQHGIADEGSKRMEAMANQFYGNIASDAIIMKQIKETKAAAEAMELKLAERNAQRGSDEETMEQALRVIYQQQQAKLAFFKEAKDYGYDLARKEAAELRADGLKLAQQTRDAKQRQARLAAERLAEQLISSASVSADRGTQQQAMVSQAAAPSRALLRRERRKRSLARTASSTGPTSPFQPHNPTRNSKRRCNEKNYI